MGYISPWLYARGSNNKIKKWQIEAKDNIMIIRSGYIDGKIKETPPKKIVGKNIGKLNATTDAEQAILESKSKMQKKLDSQYTENQSDIKEYKDQEVLLPMLAHKYTERKHKIKFPCYVQPKLNGVRCIFQNGKFMSRRGKEFTTLDHLRPELKELGIDIPDGEIYTHGMNFQEIIRLVKKDRGDGSNAKLEYWIYDQINEKTFKQRHNGIFTAFPPEQMDGLQKLKYVRTIEVNSEEEIKQWHNEWVKQGFEGIIIRNTAGIYKVAHRSTDLQKLKMFLDEEFLVVGGKAGTGTMEGCCVFECETKDGHHFNVMPKGNLEIRREYYKNLHKYVRKMLTVRYQEKSEPPNSVPIFGIGICFRDYE